MISLYIKIRIIIILIIILIWLVRPLIKIKRELKRKEYLINDTYERVEKFGVVTSVIGGQRSGKTLTMSLLGHMLTIIYQDKLQSKINEIIASYVNLDFNYINETLDKHFSESLIYETDVIYQEIFEDLRGVNHDFINIRSIRKDLSDYIDFYYILNYRNNYILSNFYIFNRITLTKSKDLENGETLELKNLWKTRNYRCDRALAIIKDEENVNNGNVNSNNKEVKTSGLKEFSSLVGNMYEELTRLITSKQVYEDEFIGTRRLEVTRLDMNSCREIIYDFKWLKRKIDKWLKFRYWLFTFKYRVIPFKRIRQKKIEQSYLKANNKYRKKVFFWNGVKNYLTSKGLLVINVDVTENKKTMEDVELFFPVSWGYGTYRTHDYACVHKELSKNSKTSFIQCEDNERFDTPQKIKQKTNFLYENKAKEEKENKEEREVIEVCF